MKIEVLAAGYRPPSWVSDGVVDYTKRMPRECSVEIVEIETAKRRKKDSVERLRQQEEKGFLDRLNRDARVIALDSGGDIWSTEELARRLEQWMGENPRIQMLIGGPDGLPRRCIDLADDVWSLSRLTFPHMLVRILVCEQLYRAWGITRNHPYHR